MIYIVHLHLREHGVALCILHSLFVHLIRILLAVFLDLNLLISLRDHLGFENMLISKFEASSFKSILSWVNPTNNVF